uniref:probable disease resistance protein At1g15890 n=1 Tax=Erigeron canadensis TaxID=72917 RepID=UPI001CB8B519|nr:probable disease resistance protein At1g15890 [Erigeron canadensis]
MEESEANDFFFQISEVSNPELRDIGAKIVRKCGFLPLAIKLIATNFISQNKSVWRDTLHRLNKNDLHKNLQSDFNIPIEDLTRYAWGLKLLNEVPTLGIARDRTKTCVLNLKNANLLMDSDYSECVKMHDLVLVFVVAKVSKGDHPWLINHNDVSNWSRAEMSESCRRISLTCMGMSKFPGDFNYPNVSLLRLMNGDESLKFAEDFYEKMENLQVMACIRYLPSAIGNLVKLKLLDLTGCIDLHIQEGVLKNLVKLEELYMRVANKKGIRFTDINYKELEERSKNLSALEVEFFENNPQSKNMLYNKLESFKISMGRFLEGISGKNKHSSENTLMFEVPTKNILLESGINELFSKTESPLCFLVYRNEIPLYDPGSKWSGEA